MHYIEHDPKQINDPKYEFPLHNGDEEMAITPEISVVSLNNNEASSSNYIQQKNTIITQTNHLERIDSVESSVNDIKSEIHNISTALRSLIQTPPTFN